MDLFIQGLLVFFLKLRFFFQEGSLDHLLDIDIYSTFDFVFLVSFFCYVLSHMFSLYLVFSTLLPLFVLGDLDCIVIF